MKDDGYQRRALTRSHLTGIGGGTAISFFAFQVARAINADLPTVQFALVLAMVVSLIGSFTYTYVTGFRRDWKDLDP